MSERIKRAGQLMAWMSAMTALASPVAAQVDQQRAEIYFMEAASLCERDGGRLWGISLCGPMVFADAKNQTIATNQPPPDEERPRSLGFANAAIEWGGMRWATYIWGLLPADNPRLRGEVMIHELFHRIQPQLGLTTPAGHNDHLDSVDGRYWLQLEWRALAQALRQPGPAGTAAIRDALAFRLARRATVSGSAENERLDEIREGLAQYTATVLSTRSATEAAARAIDQLTDAEKQETFVQMFAYPSGAAYGVLLDVWSPGWRRQLQASSDLGRVLMMASRIPPTDSAAAEAARYRGGELRAAEERREQQRKARLAELRQRFVEGPVLVMPSTGGGTFDARGATPIPGSGMVYFSTYGVQGEWGTLEATKGVLVSSDRGTRSVPAPARIAGRTITGDGWTVTLAPGWVVRPGPGPTESQVVPEGR